VGSERESQHTTRLAPLVVACLLLPPAIQAAAPPRRHLTGAPSVGPSVGPTTSPVVTRASPSGRRPTGYPPVSDLLITTKRLLPLTHTDPIAGTRGADARLGRGLLLLGGTGLTGTPGGGSPIRYYPPTR